MRQSAMGISDNFRLSVIFKYQTKYVIKRRPKDEGKGNVKAVRYYRRQQPMEARGRPLTLSLGPSAGGRPLTLSLGHCGRRKTKAEWRMRCGAVSQLDLKLGSSPCADCLFLSGFISYPLPFIFTFDFLVIHYFSIFK